MQKIKVVLGADHAGYDTKEFIKKHLINKEIEIIDVSPTKKEGDDYPDSAKSLAKIILADKTKQTKGILVCGTGIGMVIAANRFKGIRAVLLLDEYTAIKARSSNDANVACLRGWDFSKQKALKLSKLFLKTQFDHQDRRIRRIKKLDKLK